MAILANAIRYSGREFAKMENDATCVEPPIVFDIRSFSPASSSSRAERKVSSWIAAEAEVETRTRALTRDVTDINRGFSLLQLILSLDDCRAIMLGGKRDTMALNDRRGCYRFDLANQVFL